MSFVLMLAFTLPRRLPSVRNTSFLPLPHRFRVLYITGEAMTEEAPQEQKFTWQVFSLRHDELLRGKA